MPYRARYLVIYFMGVRLFLRAKGICILCLIKSLLEVFFVHPLRNKVSDFGGRSPGLSLASRAINRARFCGRAFVANLFSSDSNLRAGFLRGRSRMTAHNSGFAYRPKRSRPSSCIRRAIGRRAFIGGRTTASSRSSIRSA